LTRSLLEPVEVVPGLIQTPNAGVTTLTVLVVGAVVAAISAATMSAKLESSIG